MRRRILLENKDALGVFAYYSDGSLRTYDNADTNAIGVAVLTDEHKLVMHRNWTDAIYGGFGTSMLNSGIMITTNLNTAKTDFNGESNTTKAINFLGSGNAPAAEYCRTFFNGQGYLAAVGEWQVFIDHRTEVNAMCSKINCSSIDGPIWTSTLSDHSGGAWFLYQGVLGQGQRKNPYWGRAFLKLL